MLQDLSLDDKFEILKSLYDIDTNFNFRNHSDDDAPNLYHDFYNSEYANKYKINNHLKYINAYNRDEKYFDDSFVFNKFYFDIIKNFVGLIKMDILLNLGENQENTLRILEAYHDAIVQSYILINKYRKYHPCEFGGIIFKNALTVVREKLEVPEGVWSINYNVFSDLDIKCMDLKNIKHISYNAFISSHIKTFIFSMTTGWPGKAFVNCSFEELVIKQGTDVHEDTFYNCKIGTLYLGEGIVLNHGAFNGCSFESLKVIDNKKITLMASCFKNCYFDHYEYLGDSIPEHEPVHLHYGRGAHLERCYIKSCTIPKFITEIYRYSFSDTTIDKLNVETESFPVSLAGNFKEIYISNNVKFGENNICYSNELREPGDNNTISELMRCERIVLDEKNEDCYLANGVLYDSNHNILLVERHAKVDKYNSSNLKLWMFSAAEIMNSLVNKISVKRCGYELLGEYITDGNNTLYGSVLNNEYNGELDAITQFSYRYFYENDCKFCCAGNIDTIMCEKFREPKGDVKTRKLYLGEKTSIDFESIYKLFLYVTVHPKNPYYEVAGNAVVERKSKKMIALCSECQQFIVPSEIKIIGKYAIYRQRKLETLNIPETVEQIESKAVTENLNLTSINVEETFSGDIKYDSFSECGLVETEIGEWIVGNGIVARVKGQWNEYTLDEDKITTVLPYAFSGTEVEILYVKGNVNIQINAFAFSKIKKVVFLSGYEPIIVKASTFKNMYELRRVDITRTPDIVFQKNAFIRTEKNLHTIHRELESIGNKDIFYSEAKSIQRFKCIEILDNGERSRNEYAYIFSTVTYTDTRDCKLGTLEPHYKLGNDFIIGEYKDPFEWRL